MKKRVDITPVPHHEPAAIARAVDDDTPDPPLQIKRRTDGAAIITAHQEREREFATALKKHGCTIRFFNVAGGRMSYWRVEDERDGAVMSTGFDIDVERALVQLEAGVRLEFVDLFTAGPPQALKKSDPSGVGGPFCVVCDTAGGLPCPSMVRDALRYGVRLAFPEGDKRLGPAHVHPGRCRKRLRGWLDAHEVKTTGRVLQKHGDA